VAGLAPASIPRLPWRPLTPFWPSVLGLDLRPSRRMRQSSRSRSRSRNLSRGALHGLARNDRAGAYAAGPAHRALHSLVLPPGGASLPVVVPFVGHACPCPAVGLPGQAGRDLVSFVNCSPARNSVTVLLRIRCPTKRKPGTHARARVLWAATYETQRGKFVAALHES
jgi:hypothetical protein